MRLPHALPNKSQGYRKNSNDKIYMMMNRKDVEDYQKSYEEIDIFLKQFPHLKDTVLNTIGLF